MPPPKAKPKAPKVTGPKKYGVGPLPKLPLWGWAAVGAAGVVLWKVTRPKTATTATGTVNAGDFQPVDYSGAPSPLSPGYGLGYSGTGFVGSGVPAPVSTPAAALSAHQLHLLHLQHLANTRTTAKRPGGGTGAHARSAHQLHLLHMQHLAHLAATRR